MRFGDKLRMKMRDAVIAFKYVASAGNSSTGFVDLISTYPFFVPPKGDALTLINLYNTSPWVRTIVHKISRAVARPRWYIEGDAPAKPGAKAKRIDKHPGLDFLRAGSDMMRGKQAIALTQTYLDLCGEAFWAIGRTGADGKGKAVNYAPIPPHWVLDKPHFGQPNFRIQPRLGTIIEVPPTQVLCFRDPDPADPYGRGIGATHAAKVELDTDKAAADFLNAYFKNHARPDIIISGSEKMPLSNADRLRAEQIWQERHRGTSKAGRPFFSSGEIKAQEVGFGLRDNVMDKIREQQRKLIAEFYNIPPEILGRLDHSNRATIDGADYMFTQHVVDPRLEFLRDELEVFMSAEFGIAFDTLKYESPVNEDIDQKLKIISTRPLAFTDDEVRELAGYDAFGGEHSDPPVVPEPEPVAPKDDTARKAITTAPAEPAQIAAPAVKSLSPSDIITVAEANKDPAVVAQASAIMDKLYQQLLETYGAELLEELESDVRFTLSASVQDWLRERSAELVEQADKTTSNALKASLVDGVGADESEADLIERIEQVFADAADWRAETIGQTEATAITGFGSKAAGQQAGFEEKLWLDSHDQVVRESHKKLGEQPPIPMDSSFQTESGAMAQFPGDFGDPAEDINCRCAMRPVLPGEEPDKLMSSGVGKAFGKWHKAAREKAVDGVRAKMKSIFAAQAEVVKAQLRRSMGNHPV